ncbi:MAG: Elongation factor 4 [Parcubacteria group bacterium GW2011_GWF2_38_76]|nr:MAG: Elongation factor 4 [Parcubacteria group bacterium GW2011_GWF2_38_76]HBM45586.1 elongation factor 4 [Patescibacteria group bacterium]
MQNNSSKNNIIVEMRNIRNFSIIAHIDHGKSTLADRILEVTNTIEKRKMMAQVLDSMELERERGITIKMQPVRINYALEGVDYTLNLIDTPGHIDFSYEVSRALKAVEGALLLVDATQGVQAQTLSTLEIARESGLKIIPVINKVDLPSANVEEVTDEIIQILGCNEEDIIKVSGKTGEGVAGLLEEIIKKVPPPKELHENSGSASALIFDFEYSNHQGIIVYVRVFDGSLKAGDDLVFSFSEERFTANEVGFFIPGKKASDEIKAGEIGYVVTGIKSLSRATVGDTITKFNKKLPALTGYMQPRSVVWASIYPESQDDFGLLKHSLEKLKLSDSSLDFEEESSMSLGRGFKCGFLGMLHLEIITERLKREYGINIIIAAPTVGYEVQMKGSDKRELIYSAARFPERDKMDKVFEPWIEARIIMPPKYVGDIMQMLYDHEAIVGNTEIFGDNRNDLIVEMPLRELMRNFFDELKSVSSGFASLSYKMIGMREADVARMDVLLADEPVTAFSRIISRRKIETEANDIVERLKEILPRQMFDFKIQAKIDGRIVASRSMSGMKKDVAGYLYGGDITRKMKLREKQKKGKKKMKKHGSVNIPPDVFLRVMKGKE